MDPLDLLFRRATPADLPAIVRMLAEDRLGATRDDASLPLDAIYYSAFEAIDRDANNELIVAERANAVVAVLQLTFIPYLTYRGSWRALIEGVRVDASMRGQGLGKQLMEHAIRRAGERGCKMVQLTSNKIRKDAIRFYQSLGFVASHEGLKLTL